MTDAIDLATDARRLVRSAIYDDGALTECDVQEVMEAAARSSAEGRWVTIEEVRAQP